jgi:hypothetical protein
MIHERAGSGLFGREEGDVERRPMLQRGVRELAAGQGLGESVERRTLKWRQWNQSPAPPMEARTCAIWAPPNRRFALAGAPLCERNDQSTSTSKR